MVHPEVGVKWASPLCFASPVIQYCPKSVHCMDISPCLPEMSALSTVLQTMWRVLWIMSYPRWYRTKWVSHFLDPESAWWAAGEGSPGYLYSLGSFPCKVPISIMRPKGHSSYSTTQPARSKESTVFETTRSHFGGLCHVRALPRWALNSFSF